LTSVDETIEPHPPEEVANGWRLWKAGIVRENYARADEPGVAIVFELDCVKDARRYTDDFPLTEAGFLGWFFIPLTVPLPIESLLAIPTLADVCHPSASPAIRRSRSPVASSSACQ
jgi:hypothetical protein